MRNNPQQISIGEQLKKIRIDRDLSIRDMSDICGLAVNTLSLIENGKTTPTINTLNIIANSLRIPITIFFENNQVCQKVDFIKYFDQNEETTQYGTIFSILSCNNRSEFFEPYIIKISPISTWGTNEITHSGYEFILCLNGTLEISISNDLFILKQGDSLLFNSQKPHLWKNPSGHETSFLLILIPPKHKERTITKHKTI
jgi:transcriptional regulator with XRE-family HTH domain